MGKISKVYECFELDIVSDAYRCKKVNGNGAICDTAITKGKYNVCGNLKRHIQRYHREDWRMLQEEDDTMQQICKLDKTSKELSLPKNTMSSSSRVKKLKKSITVKMDRSTFIKGILQMVRDNTSLAHFQSAGFKMLNGEMAERFDIPLTPSYIKKLILEDKVEELRRSEGASGMDFDLLTNGTPANRNLLALEN